MEQRWIFDRQHELLELRQFVSTRRSVLIHGPAGVGKTFLLESLLPQLAKVLFSPNSATINAALRNIGSELWRAGASSVRSSFGKAGLESLTTKSAMNLKGVMMDALREGDYSLVLDHVNRPSIPFAAVIREIVTSCSTPVIAIARSAHMEDVGFLHALFAERTDRYELRNFDRDTALAFAREMAKRIGLDAQNREEVLQRVIEYTAGNPGAIASMLQMATSPKYHTVHGIKLSPLYIDFRMGWGQTKP